MKPAEELAAFVSKALEAGRSRGDISAALNQAGWTRSEIEAALAAWAETDFQPPVPRPRPYVSAQEAFLYALMFMALAVSAWHITTLGFNLLDIWIPDATNEAASYRTSSIRWSISILIVAFPLFLFMNSRASRTTRADPGRRRSTVRKWFGYVTLFLAAVALLGDLVAVIYALLNGDLTVRFAAKASLVAVTAGLVIRYFRGEMAEAEDAH